MSFSLTKWLGAGVLLFAVAVLGASSWSSAQTPTTSYCPSGTKLTGWAWSSNIGWVSFNSQNGGGGPHCVVITSTNDVVGWAWSSNIGWIKFGSLSDFPTANGASTEGNARISGDRLIGWARACAGTSSGDCSSMTSRTDGWDGWIELTGSNHFVEKDSQSLIGYAWGSDVVGWLYFLASTTAPAVTAAPTCSFNPNPPEEIRPGVYELSWTAQNTNYCTAFSNNFTTNGKTSGSAEVSPTSDTTYTLSCTPLVQPAANAQCSTAVTIGGGGPGVQGPGDPEIDTPVLQMWLDNDPSQKKASMTIRAGQQAKINWLSRSSEAIEDCIGQLSGGAAPEGLNDLGTSNRENGSPYVKSMSTPGTYNFTMQCFTANNTLTGRVAGSSQTSLRIIVRDATLEEI